jgi:hypothetical protein
MTFTQENNRYLEVNMQHTIGISSRRLRIWPLRCCSLPVSWAADTASLAVGPQYDTTHVYVERGKMDAFVDSILKTFGGTSTERVLVNVTPTPSETYSQLILTPAGSFSVFDFKTPIPYPFGAERNGFLVRDMDAAIPAGQGRRRRCAGRTLRRSDWARRSDPVARRRQHAALLAHQSAQLQTAAEPAGKPPVPLRLPHR